jgi:hypothetical protein
MIKEQHEKLWPRWIYPCSTTVHTGLVTLRRLPWGATAKYAWNAGGGMGSAEFVILVGDFFASTSEILALVRDYARKWSQRLTSVDGTCECQL